MGGRRPTRTIGMTPEEEQRRQIRRERNKMAAARCRKRRMDHTNALLERILKLSLFSFTFTKGLLIFFGIYVTEVHDGSPAAKSGLRMHDKILQCNGYDFTMVTHKKAVSYIRKHPVLNLLVARKGVTST
ncbi:Uncharacterized protein C45G9.7 [Cyphomyrmex costatus]|uniref:Uncharacterized protein C45G9.7 n=1 Tax=Cyphomyrmex costatus TaxID=456900 RepID=A0A195C511_9HYME|nr:Uncharacterized protein C45G9.7 [Cyphomyrmex costatus]